VSMWQYFEWQYGYIKINRFAETTFEEFKNGLVKLKKQGAVLVIDLAIMGRLYGRGNYCWWIIKDKQLIVFTKIKREKHTRLKRAVLKQGKYLCYRMKIVPREWNSGWCDSR
jgi:carboxyl-terminal processing protease